MLYALQTASFNLRNAEFEAAVVTDVVIDRDDVHRTSIDCPQWSEEDFEGEAEEEEEAADEVENEGRGRSGWRTRHCRRASAGCGRKE